MPGPPPDAALVAGCRAGDHEAWRALVDRFSRYVYAICIQGFGLSEHDAEDVFQDVFARAYQKLPQLRSDDAVRPWLAQLTRRTCLDHLRATSRVEVTDEVPEDVVDDELERLDEAWAVREVLGTLSEACREILDRFFARDQSYSTIGAELDLPPGTVASRISRCLSTLREQAEGRIEPSRASGGR